MNGRTIEESAELVNRLKVRFQNYPLDKIFTPWYIAPHFSAGHDGSACILSQRPARAFSLVAIISPFIVIITMPCDSAGELMRSLCLCVEEGRTV